MCIFLAFPSKVVNLSEYKTQLSIKTLYVCVALSTTGNPPQYSPLPVHVHVGQGESDAAANNCAENLKCKQLPEH